MTLVATLLYGEGPTTPQRAVESVLPWVDLLLVLDSGIAEWQLNEMKELAGEKFRRVQFQWPHDFGAARNFALDQAERLNGRWAVTIDSDEALRFPGFRSQAELLAALDSRPEVQTWMTPFRGGDYAKERFVRLPTKLRWNGVVHEFLGGAKAAERGVFGGVFFDEEPKSPEALAEKLQRDREALERQVAENPKDSRAWIYLARTLESLGENEGAINAYLQCAQQGKWREEAAWAHYKAASGFHQARQYERGLQLCILGRKRRPRPELAWLAGHCCLELGRYEEAIEWGCQALADVPDPELAISGSVTYFKFIPAWFEGPHDLMRQGYLRSGNLQEAEKAKSAQLTAIERREAAYSRFYPPPEADQTTLTRVKPLQRVEIELLYSYDDPSSEER